MKHVLLTLILLVGFATGCAAQGGGGDTPTPVDALKARLRDHEAESEKNIRTVIDYVQKLEKRVHELEVDLESMKIRVAMLGGPEKPPADTVADQQKVLAEKQSEDVAVQYIRGTTTLENAVKEISPNSKYAVPTLVRLLKKLKEGFQFDESKKIEVLLTRMPLADIKSSIAELARDTTLRLSALTLVEAFGDVELSRSLEPLLQSGDEGFRVLAALALVRCKNKAGIPVLIQAMKKADLNARMSFSQLEKTTHQNLGYSSLNSEEQNKEPVKRWEEWWQKEGATFTFQ